MMALASLCQSVPAINWTNQTIGAILQDGHAGYRAILNAANATGRKYSAAQHLRNEDLELVGQRIFAAESHHHVHFTRNFFGMVTRTYAADDFFQPLRTNLRLALNGSEKILFLCRGKWIAVEQSGE